MKNFGFKPLGFQTSIHIKLRLSATQVEILQAKFPKLYMESYYDKGNIYTKIIGALDNYQMPDFIIAKDLAKLYSKREFISNEIHAIENPLPMDIEAYLPA